MAEDFKEIVWDYYRREGRDLPWRQAEGGGTYDPYKILVSEMMLQQTQVSRVVQKYSEFLTKFPSIHDAADTSLGDMLRAWSGLGYNRRAKYLHDACKVLEHANEPWTLEVLMRQPGIGANTAAAIAVYAYNQSLAFIETNIRTVFIHHFFADASEVADKDILPFVEAELDHEHPREWYWALMDYGTFLKRTVGNTSKLSKHYRRQSQFVGSDRQIRGHVLRLLANVDMPEQQLKHLIADIRLDSILEDLMQEGLVVRGGKKLHLPR